MRILFEVTHPKHLHLFKNPIWELEARGHTVAITARDKDVTLDLLRSYGLEFTALSRKRTGLVGMTRELLVRDWRLWCFARRFRPDVLVARVGPSAAHVGLLLGRPVIVFEDTEHATLQQRITFPFVTHVCTATHYEKDWGAKHVRYQSFDELAYLHPRRFTPDRAVVERAGLEPGKYIIVRYVSWQAAHDIGQSGVAPRRRLEVLEQLERHGRVLVTSESPLLADYERFRVPVPPVDFHHVVAYARLVFGESATVAAEAAILGVPAIFVSTLRAGSLNRLEHHYGLAYSVSTDSEALALAERLLDDPATPERWRQGRERLLAEEQDLTAWMIQEVECLGNSA